MGDLDGDDVMGHDLDLIYDTNCMGAFVVLHRDGILG
jgi:hypothetical protein